KSMVSIREHNEARQTAQLVRQLVSGKTIALVSDAGTPAIADPGARLVQAAHAAAVRVVPIPGCSAVLAALSASGFQDSQFTFVGFPPSSDKARKDWLTNLSMTDHVLVMFEAPHRITRTIDDIGAIFVKRPIVIWREITKLHEELVIKHNNQSSEPPIAR